MRFWLVFFSIVVMTSVVLAADITVIDLVGADSCGELLDSIFHEVGYDSTSVKYETWIPWFDSSLWVIWTGMAEYGPWYELDQMETVRLIDHLMSGRYVWIWGAHGALGVTSFWLQTDICTAVVDPISQFTGSGVLNGLTAACSESLLSLCSCCIVSFDGTAILEGNHNNCSGRATVCEDARYGFKGAVFNVDPRLSDRQNLGQIVSRMARDYFGIYPTAIDDEVSHPFIFALAGNYPNPFNSQTVINYFLSASSRVTLSIYDALGREIVTLVDQQQEMGDYQIIWDAHNCPSGVYFSRLSAGSVYGTKKMLLAK